MGWLGGKGKTSQMTYVIINIRIMIEYFVPIKLPSLSGYLNKLK